MLFEGGQTMNPSTEDFIKAVEQVNARNIIFLPNNKNIFMAAQSAAEVFGATSSSGGSSYFATRFDKSSRL